LIVILALVLSLGLVLVPPAEASPDGPFVITVDYSDYSIYTVDTATNTVYGPFLSGQLGSDWLADVTVTPDGQTAVLCSFDGQTVYFVDVSDPTNPSFLGSLGVGISSEDIDITSDGKFALVTDGGGTPDVLSINIQTRSIADTATVSSAQAVAVAPDGTVITADQSASQLTTLTIDGSGNLTVGSTYTSGLSAPGNIGIAPDGQTVIAGNRTGDTVAIYQITGPGTLSYKTTISGLPTDDQQTIAFNEAGDRAYVLSMGPSPDQISVLDITGPGAVSLNTAGAATLSSDRATWYGVETMVVVGNTLYVGGEPGTTDLALVNLTTYGVTTLAVGSDPNGVARIGAGVPLAAPVADFGASLTMGEAPLSSSMTCQPVILTNGGGTLAMARPAPSAPLPTPIRMRVLMMSRSLSPVRREQTRRTGPTSS
jgi:WD40 repeat protein